MQAVPCSSICRPKGKGSKQLCGSPATMLHWPVHALLVSGGSASIRGKALNQKLSGEHVRGLAFPEDIFRARRTNPVRRGTGLIQGLQVTGPGLHGEAEKRH